MGVLFLDLKKAFDAVDHQRAVNILSNSNMSQKCLKWYHNYLTDRSQITRVTNIESDSMKLTCGVPQGSILCWLGKSLTSREHASGYMRSPCNGHEMGCLLLLPKPKQDVLIFILYINTLPTALVDSKTFLYADDIAIICNGQNVKEVNAKLSLQLDQAMTWLSNDKLSLNPGDVLGNKQ